MGVASPAEEVTGEGVQKCRQALADNFEGFLPGTDIRHLKALSVLPLPCMPPARKNGVKIIDLRKPKPTDQLHFWCGDIFKVRATKIGVLVMDCSIGKRTTARFIKEMCRQEGIRTEMIYTGQTGWLQGYKHGFIFDATLNDFVSGELEYAVVECDRHSSPDLILIEG